jgi:pyruvate/2-oxoglutarate dehydrogenase complex dihydrolipoamide acyltransferase (E2) component
MPIEDRGGHMRRIIVSVVAAGVVLAGCGDGGTDSETAEPAAVESEPAGDETESKTAEPDDGTASETASETAEPDDGTPSETAEPRPVASEPAVGACIEDMSVLESGDHATHTPAALVFVDCAGVHDAEIAGVLEIDGDEYPGVEAIGSEMGEDCMEATSNYLHDPDMAHNEVVYIPQQSHWEDGYREMLCFVVSRGDEGFEGPVGG